MIKEEEGLRGNELSHNVIGHTSSAFVWSEACWVRSPGRPNAHSRLGRSWKAVFGLGAEATE